MNSYDFIVVDGAPILRVGVGALLSRSKNGARTGEIAPGESIRNVDVGAAQLIALIVSGRLECAPERVREIRCHAPDVPLLVLASGADDDNAIRVLRAGATSYVRHSAEVADLLAAIDATCRRQRFLGADVAAGLSDRLLLGQRQRHEDLSDRELQMLVRLADGQRVKDIASELCLSVKTISSYRARLLEKLDLKSNADLTRYALANELIADVAR
ncbi:response regulator transcription factor [Burkholderia plantarii]|uniref:response regulator transcription factor n=1 Tax=Burkholderia plantarii TaxID=41899 RepID=UPI0018DC4029|nr:response regulator transcription factor [Burkholderia plantarii]MBI0328336.1 response regulator transcription factor [Burkholderia plantarii]